MVSDLYTYTYHSIWLPERPPDVTSRTIYNQFRRAILLLTWKWPIEFRHTYAVYIQQIIFTRFVKWGLGTGVCKLLPHCSSKDVRTLMQRGSGFYRKSSGDKVLVVWMNVQREMKKVQETASHKIARVDSLWKCPHHQQRSHLAADSYNLQLLHFKIHVGQYIALFQLELAPACFVLEARLRSLLLAAWELSLLAFSFFFLSADDSLWAT